MPWKNKYNAYIWYFIYLSYLTLWLICWLFWLKRAKANGQIRGVIPHLVDDGLSILQYADHTIIFLDYDLEYGKNLKLLLCAFEQLSGLKINFHKREIFYYGAAKQMEDIYTDLFGCNAGEYPFRYLGIPMHHRQLLNSEWSKIEERFEKKLLLESKVPVLWWTFGFTELGT